MTITVQAIQSAQAQATITWDSTDPDPVAGFQLLVDINAAGPIGLGILSGTARLFIDQGLWAIGDSVVYSVRDEDTLTVGSAPGFTIADLDQPYTYGLVDPLAAAFRYTTLADVKLRLGIEHAEYDAALTVANQAAETAIDQTLGRSLPDQGGNPEISGVPGAITNWAVDSTIALWKATDAPFGQAGSDTWLGSIDVIGETERVMRRHPGAYGYKVSWGVA